MPRGDALQSSDHVVPLQAHQSSAIQHQDTVDPVSPRKSHVLKEEGNAAKRHGGSGTTTGTSGRVPAPKMEQRVVGLELTMNMPRLLIISIL